LSVLHGQNNNPTPFERLLRRDRTIVSIALLILILLACEKKYIDGACVLADADGDKIFSTFDIRDVDKSQPDMACGTHVITGGTGKYAGITGEEPFACNSLPALAGEGGYSSMDIPHNTTWEIKKATRAE
jgi:hypothetical protein